MFLATIFITRYGKQLLVKYSRYAYLMERRVVSLTPLECLRKKNDAMLQPHHVLVTSVLADSGTKTSAVFLIRPTLYFFFWPMLLFTTGKVWVIKKFPYHVY